MRALCVARHPFLSEHLGRVFGRMGFETIPATGLDEALRLAERESPDVALCEIELLGVAPLETWERHPLLSRVPILAVSLTRRPDEALLPPSNGIAGFIYLPTLRPEDARRILRAARPPASFVLPSVLDRPAPTAAPPAR